MSVPHIPERSGATITSCVAGARIVDDRRPPTDPGALHDECLHERLRGRTPPSRRVTRSAWSFTIVAESLHFAVRYVDLQSRDTERTGALAVMVEERGSDAEHAFGLFFVVGGVPLDSDAIEILDQQVDVGRACATCARPFLTRR